MKDKLTKHNCKKGFYTRKRTIIAGALILTFAAGTSIPFGVALSNVYASSSAAVASNALIRASQITVTLVD